MKQLALFLIVIMLIKPLWPLAEYALNYNYIVENLCENKSKPKLNCNGKCFLAKQLAKETKGKDKNPFETKFSKIEIQLINSFHQITIEHGFNATTRGNFKTPQVLKSDLFTTDIEQPPELS